MAFIKTLVLITSTLTSALYVAPGSPQCAELCGNTLTSTNGAEISCNDADYATNTYGASFKSCIACELASTYVDTSSPFKPSDLGAALYNFRFAMSWCVFGWENNTVGTNTPCSTSFACGPLISAFEYDSLNPNASAYSYCPNYDQDQAPKCADCLLETGYTNTLGNFVTVLDAACIQQPALPNATLSFAGSVFSSTRVNITTPTPSSLSHFTPSKGGLTLGGKIGIAVGAIIVLLVTTGFCIVWRGKRTRRRILAEKARQSGYEWEARHGTTRDMGDVQGHGQQFFDSPASQRPFATAWGYPTDSPESANPEKAYFSPYQSQHTSPVTPIVGPSKPTEWPRDKKVAVPEEGGERIEMGRFGSPDTNDWSGNPAPVLSHPGYGRGAPIGLTEEDARMGHAL